MKALVQLLAGILVGFVLVQAAGVVVEYTMLDVEPQLFDIPPPHPEVAKLLRYHGVQFFDWNPHKQEYGFWRDGKWCPAR